MSRNAPKYRKPAPTRMGTLARQAASRAARLSGSRMPAPRNRARVKGAIRSYGQELKYVDTAVAGYACDTTGTVTALNLIAVGDDNTTRDGRQVTIKSVQLRGLIRPVDTTTSSTYARVMLVWDNAVNSGSIATVADILTAATAASFPLVNNSQRFTVISDQSFAVGALNNTATQTYALGPGVQTVDIYRKINQITQYSGTTAAIGSIQNGALLLVTIGDQAPNDGAIAAIAARVRFCDV